MNEYFRIDNMGLMISVFAMFMVMFLSSLNHLKLSKERADAVKNELVSKYSVKAEQLIPYGDGQTAPVTTNATKEGRAKNRRVEIVEE